MKQPLPVDLLTEAEWTTQVVDLARLLGWARYHTYRSKRSAPGFPDECLVRDRVVFLELKTMTGKLSEPQRDWLARIIRAGTEAYVVRPDQYDELAAVLRHGAPEDLATPLVQATIRELGLDVVSVPP